MLGTILGNAYGITLGIDVGKELGYLDVSLDDSNYGNLEVLLLEGLPGYAGGKVSGSDEGIKLENSYSKVLGPIIGNVYGTTLGIYVGT